MMAWQGFWAMHEGIFEDEYSRENAKDQCH